MKDVLTQKIADALAAQLPAVTRRDVRLPAVRGKAPAVVGMRRSGKTTFLWHASRTVSMPVLHESRCST
jgi:uncharacterized protein